MKGGREEVKGRREGGEGRGSERKIYGLMIYFFLISL